MAFLLTEKNSEKMAYVVRGIGKERIHQFFPCSDRFL